MAEKQPSFFTRVRTYTLLLSSWILNLGMFGFKLKSVCSPGFNCHGCPWATFACPIGVMTFSSAVRTIPAMAIGFVLAIGVVLGRLICGFVCPFGLLQDILHKIPSKKVKLPKITRYLKYAALLLLVFLLPYWFGFHQAGYLQIDSPSINLDDSGTVTINAKVKNLGAEPVKNPELDVIYFDKESKKEVYRERKKFDMTVEPGETVAIPPFNVSNKLATADLVVDSPQSMVAQSPRYDLYYCRLCPNGTLTASVPSFFTGKTNNIYGKLQDSALRIGILVFFLILMVIASRPFCRTFCPLGAIYAMISGFALMRIEVNEETCIQCRRCDKVCPIDLDVVKEAGGPECIACGDCIQVCPVDAIKRKFGLSNT